MLGICDKIVPGLVIGALAFGHLPTVFVPAGPMPSGMSNSEKTRIRQLYAEGKVGRDGAARGRERLLPRARHLHLLRHRQLQPDADGDHGPAPAGRRLRQPQHAAARRADPRGDRSGSPRSRPWATTTRRSAACSTSAPSSTASSACMATGGSTNHTLHLVAMARAAGILLNWDDFADLSGVDAAAGPHLPERPRRREPVPGGRRHAASSSASCSTPACSTPTC